MMRDERAVLVLTKRERQAFEGSGRSVPRELVRQPFDPRLKLCAERAPYAGVHAVCGDDRVVTGNFAQTLDAPAEADRDAGVLALGMEEAQELEAADCAK